jgi:hypothetical protein
MGTLGKLETEGFSCVTMEPPWADNQPNVSCIPVGEYLCRWHKSPRYGWVYAVLEVPGRTNILIHPGNVVTHTLGCVLPGSRFGELAGAPAVLVSRAATRRLTNHLGKNPFTLEVRDA